MKPPATEVSHPEPAERDTAPRDIDYRALFESIDEGFCICEMIVDEGGNAVDYRFLEANSRFAELTGIQADAIGRTARELVPGLESQWVDTYARVGLGGETLRFEERSEVMGRAFDVWASPFGPSGSGKLAIVFRDITRQKQTEEALRQSEARLSLELAASRQLQEISTRLVGEETPDALYDEILDAAVVIMQSDFASLQKLHTDRRVGGELELLGSRGFTPEAVSFFQWVGLTSGSACGEALRTGRRCIVPDVETCDFMIGTDDLPAQLQTGIHAVQTTLLRSRSGPVLGMISTHWREPHHPSEDELRRFDVLARQAADLIERAQTETALRRSSQLKDELLGMVSHEFRTPLTTIAGNIDILTRRLHELPGDALAQLLEELRGDSARLQRLVENMLIIARGGAPVEVEPLLLQHVLPAIVDGPQRQSGPGRVTLSASPELPPVLAVAGYLDQVLENLVTNARKYASPGADISVTCERADDQVVVRVTDEGEILDDREVEQFFEPFYRDRNHSSHVSGAGLGLAVCARLVESMGGSISARPNPGGGLEVSFSLRVADD